MTALMGPPGSCNWISDVDGRHQAQQLRARASSGARWLQRSRSEPHPRVGLLVEPSADWVSSWLAIVSSGAIAVPLSPRYPEPELRWLLEDAGASHVVVSKQFADKIPAGSAAAVRTEELIEGAADSGALDELCATTDADVAMLLYTSGTTGKPKGVMLSHRNLAHQARLLCSTWALDDQTVLLHALPLHHMHGIAIALLPCLVAGASTRLLPRFEALRIWGELAKANTFMGVPTMYYQLLERFDAAKPAVQTRWSQHARALRLATSGSAALPSTTAERWRAISGRIPVERWGMSEIGVGCSNPLDPKRRRAGRVGQPLESIELRLDETELWVRGPSIFGGYWRRPDATAAAFSEDGWFRTGDAAQIDPADGSVRILGRKSVDILKSAGYKVSALEIEEVMRDHPAIAEIAVVGLADEQWGQVVVAAVVCRPGQGEACQSETLRSWASEHIASYKVPRRFVTLAELPRNAVGKVLKPELARLLAS